MIHTNGKAITGVYCNDKTITAVYNGSKLVWLITQDGRALSCYANGYWIDENPWTDDTGWKD